MHESTSMNAYMHININIWPPLCSVPDICRQRCLCFWSGTGLEGGVEGCFQNLACPSSLPTNITCSFKAQQQIPCTDVGTPWLTHTVWKKEEKKPKPKPRDGEAMATTKIPPVARGSALVFAFKVLLHLFFFLYILQEQKPAFIENITLLKAQCVSVLSYTSW